jgi:hypothetical protein
MGIDSSNLHLHEEILLLALNDEKGSFHWKTYLPALGGAVAAELLTRRRIEVEETKKKLVNLLDDHPFGEPVLDEALEKIKTTKKRASLTNWVLRFSRISKLQHKVAMGLCRRGIIKEDEEQILVLFRRRIYPPVDSRPERAVVERLRRAIFGDTQELDSRTVILISLAKSADLLSIPFEKRQLKERKERINQIVKGQLLGEATKAAVDAAAAAVMVAAILPAVTAATVTAARSGR